MKLLFRLITRPLKARLLLFKGKAYLAVRKVWKQEGEKTRQEFIRKRLSGRPGLKRRTGALARSVRARVRGATLNTLRFILSAGYGKARSYARAHESRITISGKGKYLAIPAPRFRGAELQASPLQWKDQFRIRKGRRGIYLQNIAGGPDFVLVPQVTTKPRMQLKKFLFKKKRKFISLAKKAVNKLKL